MDSCRATIQESVVNVSRSESHNIFCVKSQCCKERDWSQKPARSRKSRDTLELEMETPPFSFTRAFIPAPLRRRPRESHIHRVKIHNPCPTRIKQAPVFQFFHRLLEVGMAHSIRFFPIVDDFLPLVDH